MNCWDILLILLLLAVAALAVLHLVRVKRQGGTVCGGDCAACQKDCAGRTSR